ncbi:patatin-like phospholipase family protein [Legionella maioricensis]|uniref:Patatin-like phospholipase family protein n=1 Tax=Legionella maioricensis TaxID=2896528 RepID=A0A9X2CZW8_9GAMM|nr:patatin-like phospholipase family protein [Legionella maioricensis]MCL9684025.1 patatin-like phospholipase family protein [Legionella maioricensis]MCL9687930.1 patatin-like phospholipase family protein [Legionella maioricensis]
MPRQDKKKKLRNTVIACSFQGGGALGAYQVGIVHALDEAGYAPDWFVGTSIGAMNAAIAAGNPPQIRVEKMHQFWDTISTPEIFHPFMAFKDPENRKIQHLLSSQYSLFMGQPGFFRPRFPPPELGWHDSADLLSYYDTSPLRSTLEQFIDFDRINDKNTTRLSLGAVEISSGQMEYFDSDERKIGPEHIMASGALPPGFPAVEVDGKLYWDGGISSNSPATYVLSHRCPKDLLCFAIHLFDSYGLNPTNLDEILQRKKDIEFSSRMAKVIQLYQEIHALKNSIHLLAQHLPKDQKLSPEMKLCISRGKDSNINLVRFLYEADRTELSSKDYEFSKTTIAERIAHGYRDGRNAIKKSPWLEPVPQTLGVAVYDMCAKNHLNINMQEEEDE